MNMPCWEKLREHQSDRPCRQSERTGEVAGQIGHQHVEAEVDAELVDHQQPTRPAEAAEFPNGVHYLTASVGLTTVVHRVQESTTVSAG